MCRFLEELAAKADLNPQTLRGYAIAFRAIVADIFKINGGKEKFDYRGGGHALWLAKIHAIKLADVTPERVQAWKRTFIDRARDEPVKQRSAKTSFNSFLRRAKSLFAPGAIKHLSATLPSPLPFDGIEFEKRQLARYRSSIDPAELTRAAQKELSEADPPVFLAFLLALGAGLRRGEIDQLEWAAFQWNHNVIRIEPTRYFEPKTEHSIGFRDRGGGGADLPLAPGARTFADHYRAKAVFERLSVWLRAHGVTAGKPIHELRKEFGSMVNRQHELSAAERPTAALRHRDYGGVLYRPATQSDQRHRSAAGDRQSGRRSSSSS